MSDPGDFTSFADFLGLNDQVGQDMMAKTMKGYGGMSPDQIRQMGDNHSLLATEAGEGTDAGAYNRSGEAVRQGLSSYGDFMKGMNDPAQRQALMEKTYGRGAANWLDSSLAGAAGGGGQLADANQGYNQLSSDINRQGVNADQRKSDATMLKGQYAAQDAHHQKVTQDAYNQRKQDAKDKISKQQQGVADWAKNGGGHGGQWEYNTPGADNAKVHTTRIGDVDRGWLDAASLTDQEKKFRATNGADASTWDWGDNPTGSNSPEQHTNPNPFQGG